MVNIEGYATTNKCYNERMLQRTVFVCCECHVLSGRGLCDELITRPEESYRLCCVVVCDLETSSMGAPYIYDISRLRVNSLFVLDSVDERKLWLGCLLSWFECI